MFEKAQGKTPDQLELELLQEIRTKIKRILWILYFFLIVFLLGLIVAFLPLLLGIAG